MTHAELMQWRREKTLMRQKKEQEAKWHRETESCTFRPDTSQSMMGIPTRAAKVVAPPYTRYDELYARAVSQWHRQEERHCHVMEGRRRDEMKDCTFKPDVQNSVRSHTRSQTSSVP